jgi:hypothetical protein
LFNIYLEQMKFTALVFLITALLLQTLHQSLVYVGFNINEQYISVQLCENKTQPKLNCHGKCHLKKELQKEEQQEKQLPSVKYKSEFVQLPAKHIEPFFFISNKSIALSIPQSIGEINSFQVSVFQPPKQVA